MGVNRCFSCGYCWADLDEDGVPISNEYCHYDGPIAWAPCEQDDYEEDFDEPTFEEYGAPYDYQEF